MLKTTTRSLFQMLENGEEKDQDDEQEEEEEEKEDIIQDWDTRLKSKTAHS